MSTTITTIHPLDPDTYEYLPSTYTDWTTFPLALCNQLLQMMRTLPYYNTFISDTLNPVRSNNDYLMNVAFDGIAGTFCFDMVNAANYAQYTNVLVMYHIFNGAYYKLYVQPYVFYSGGIDSGTSVYTNSLKSFEMTRFETSNANGIQFTTNATYHVKMFLFKAYNVDDPTDFIYAPAYFVYDDRLELTNSITDKLTPDSAVYTSNQCIIFNGIGLDTYAEIGRYKDGLSTSYVLRQYASNRYIYPDLYVIEGGIAPVYNSGARIRFGDDEYMYLCNRFYLKLS